MAARSLLISLASISRAGAINLPVRTAPRHRLHLSATSWTPSVASTTPGLGDQVFDNRAPASAEDLNDSKHAAFLGEADSNDGHEVYRESYGTPPPALDAKNAAFLGEADSDDAFEAQRAAEGDRIEPLDAKHAAFLGEADSDDAFEARKTVEGDKHEPLDAHNAAFLGEADSDDAFEADVELHPEKHRHNIQDTSPSGLHGQGGEQDQ